MKNNKFDIKKFTKKYVIPNAFYRVSIKGLILDETRKKFLVIQEDNKWWELPGGGLDWGESPEQCLRREIKEEMGLTVTKINPAISYYIVFNKKKTWILNLIFEIRVKDLDFTPSQECQKIKFISPKDINKMNVFNNVKQLAKLFNSKK